MVLRVMKVTETIRSRSIYDGWIPPPREGQLIMGRNKGTGELQPWSFDVGNLNTGNPVMQALFRDYADAN